MPIVRASSVSECDPAPRPRETEAVAGRLERRPRFLRDGEELLALGVVREAAAGGALEERVPGKPRVACRRRCRGDRLERLVGPDPIACRPEGAAQLELKLGAEGIGLSP